MQEVLKELNPKLLTNKNNQKTISKQTITTLKEFLQVLYILLRYIKTRKKKEFKILLHNKITFLLGNFILLCDSG